MTVKVFRSFCCCLLLLCVMQISAVPASGEQYRPGEYEMKAAYIYKFISFIEWPPEALTHPEEIFFCVLGEDSFVTAFDSVSRMTVRGRRLRHRHAGSAEQLRGCDIVFIGRSEEARLPRTLRALRGTHALTIGDTEGFSRRGTVINFYIAGEKLRFEINEEAARRAGLKISSKLLSLAGRVYDSLPQED